MLPNSSLGEIVLWHRVRRERERRLDVAVWHHEDHRPGLVLGDEVVHDVVGAHVDDPVGVVAAPAVQEVQNGVSTMATVVAGRRVDLHLALGVGEVGVVADGRPGAVRNRCVVCHVVCCRAGDKDITPGRGRSGPDVAVRGIGDVYAIENEAVPVPVRRERTDGYRPDAAGAFGHRNGIGRRGWSNVVLEVELHVGGLGS